ncbi:hypothetical protein LY90DRAFT_706211 [Neocallimastix californiae]|uniref:Uncharacterized protein n=1 Tax=Neocallimastix californiae TaxID=1754190 RepID=A0A1Y2ATI5_9FUNG|nr:hypothetical protein LY90DRAFT_706211 [Neocallimastix californiae]|eukprot:ORY25879.1 hypothetical protein LY90DRAFT_706211 [Neocallimastix californiae]
MKTLVLSPSKSNTDTITLTLKSYGIPYDLIKIASQNEIKGNLTLYSTDNEPKYNLVVVNGGNLNIESNGKWKSALTSEQWANLEEYEAKISCPEVSLYNSNKWGDSKSDQPLIVETSDEVKKIFNDARIKITAPLDVDDIYFTRIKIANTQTTRPFLYYEENGKKGAVAATITSYTDGREKLSFYFELANWSQSSIILGHLWLMWGTRGLFNGFRRVYFTPHIDDVFLSTELVDVKHNKEYSKYSEDFRTVAKDYQKIAQFQKDVLDIMPEGSFYRIELAFNGNGFLLNVDYDYALEVDGERYVDLEFVKEPGTGEKRWPKENYQFSSTQLKNFKKDNLFKFFANNSTAQKEFFWSSHTFSHENLDNASRSDVDNEIRLNIEVAKLLGLTDKEWWSTGAIVTPQISGLHNKDALEIFKQYGINSATGDLSRSAITNLENPYLPFYTTLESSNYEGFPVVPRTPTEIYYFCSNRTENTWMYNNIYRNEFGRDSTWDEIAEREAHRTLLLMTQLRHEAHQFHQANIRHYKKEGKYGESLLEDWTRSVVSLYNQYVEWPLISLKIDDQAQTFVERAKLENCGAETKLITKGGSIVGISVTATQGECTVPITVPEGVKEDTLPEDARLEKIGKDPLTVWIPLKKGETKSFSLSQSLEWGIEEEEVEKEETTAVASTTEETTEEPTTTVDSKVTTTAAVEPETTTVIITTTVPKTTTTTTTTTTTVPKTTTTTTTTTTTVPKTTTTTTTTTTTVPKTTTKTTTTTTTTTVPKTTTKTTTTKTTKKSKKVTTKKSIKTSKSVTKKSNKKTTVKKVITKKTKKVVKKVVKN